MQRPTIFQDDENTRRILANQGEQLFVEAANWFSGIFTQPHQHPIFFLQGSMFFIDQAIQCYQRAAAGNPWSTYNISLQQCFAFKKNLVENYGDLHFQYAIQSLNNNRFFDTRRYIKIVYESYRDVGLRQDNPKIINLIQLVEIARERFKGDLEAVNTLADMEAVLKGKEKKHIF